MTIQQEVFKSELSAKIELFHLDLSTTGIAELATVNLYLTPSWISTTGITFQGNTYIPWAVLLDGEDDSSDSAPARPQLHIGNTHNNSSLPAKYIGGLAFKYFDLNLATVYYHKTFEAYLASGLSVPRKYTIARKLSHDKDSLTFELRDPTDKERSKMPHRQMLKKDFPGLGVNKHV